MNEYNPIHVAEARRLAQDHNASMIVIVAYDPHHERTNVVSFGVSPQDKEDAARIAQECGEFLTGEPAGKYHQDYRFMAEGERAQVVDRLVAALRGAESLLKMVHAGDADRIADDRLEEVLGDIRAAIQGA